MVDDAAPRRPLSISVSGILGTVAVLLVALVCVRLGIWQLHRLAQRRVLNAGIAGRMHAAPVTIAGPFADTVGFIHRRAMARGTFDNGRSIVLPGRSYRGSPGVQVLTPLRLEGSEIGLLVNRGWLPATDAATVDLRRIAVSGVVTVDGLLVPFPSSGVAPAPATAGSPQPFRRVWFRLDGRALRAQYPYPLLDVELQQLPAAGAPAYPIHLDPPALDEGPHLGYAIQWFSFATIAIVGWFAMVLRSRRTADRREPGTPKARWSDNAGGVS